MVTPAQRRVSRSSARRRRRLVVEPLEDRALLAPFTVGGDPSVNPADFRITTFVSGLNYPGGMLTLSDGSLLVGVSNPVSGTSYFNSIGELLRFTDTDGNGVADNAAGEVLYNGLPGDLTALSQAGEFILATSSEGGSERISVLRAGATPAAPLTLAGSINFSFASGWWHTTYASAVRPAPGLPGEYDVFFNIGSENNGVARDGNGNVILDGNGNPTYQLTTDPVTASGLIGGTLLGDSIYMVTLQDNNGTPILSNLTRVASGLRNAASMAVDSAGDLFFADNGIDGNDNGEYGWSTDELDEIPAAQIGGPTEFFGFPEMINGQLDVSYAKTNSAPGQAVTVVNPGVGVQPLIPFEPLPDSNLAPLGSRSQGASGFALSPPDFPAGLNDGVFVGFHGEYDSGGIANGKNPLVYADPSTGHYFDFVSNDEAGVGHFDGAVSTSNSLFLSDISPGGSMDSGAGQGAIYQIEAISPSPDAYPDSDAPSESTARAHADRGSDGGRGRRAHGPGHGQRPGWRHDYLRPRLGRASGCGDQPDHRAVHLDSRPVLQHGDLLDHGRRHRQRLTALERRGVVHGRRPGRQPSAQPDADRAAARRAGSADRGPGRALCLGPRPTAADAHLQPGPRRTIGRDPRPCVGPLRLDGAAEPADRELSDRRDRDRRRLSADERLGDLHDQRRAVQSPAGARADPGADDR